MMERLFPKTINNIFPGNRIALYVFYLLTAVTLWRSQHHIFASDGGAQSIATIPLDRFSGGGADAVVTIFALWGLSQLIVALIYLAACIRYKSLVPFLYLLFIVEYAGRLLIGQFKPLETLGTAPGAVANIPFVVLGVLMLVLSLIPSNDNAQSS